MVTTSVWYVGVWARVIMCDKLDPVSETGVYVAPDLG